MCDIVGVWTERIDPMLADEYRVAIQRFTEAEPDIPFNLHKDLTKIIEGARNWIVELERLEKRR